MRIVFMGTPEFAVPSLKALLDSRHTVVGVVTGPNRPAGRSLKIRSSPVKALAQQHYLRLLQPENLEAPEFIGELQEINPDLCLVVAFRILPPAVIGIPELGCINLHASLLPELRGAAPINWALMQGLTRTGITAFLIERRVDTGGILLQREIEILPEDDHGSLADQIGRAHV